MRVYYLGILRNTVRPAVELCSEKDLSKWSRFTQGSVGDFMALFSKTVAERTSAGSRQDIEEQDFTFHVYARSEGVCAVMISDKEYPGLPAHRLLSKLLDEFLTKNPSVNAATDLPNLKEYMRDCQNPDNIDSIMKIQKELDETKIVLHKTIESVLERGEKLDDLVQKSDQLSSQSKMFYKQAQKQNSCCIVM